MARTQMRLDAITGSFAGIQAEAHLADRVAKKAPSAIVAADLEGVLGEFSAAIERIHGQDFSNQDAGKFEHATIQLVGDVSGSANLKISGNITGSGDVRLDKSGETVLTKAGAGNLRFDIQGAHGFRVQANGAERFSVTSTQVKTEVLANLSGAQIQDLAGAAGSLVFRDGARTARASSDIVWDDAVKTLSVVGGVTGSRGLFTGEVTIGGNLTVNGTMTTVNSTTLQVDDKNIELAHSPSGSPLDDVGIDGAGITVASTGGAKEILWKNAAGSDPSMWLFNGGLISGSAVRTNVKNAEYMYADDKGQLQAGAFQASGDDMVLVDSPLGSVTYSLKFPVSGSGDFDGLDGGAGAATSYIPGSLSVFEALVLLDRQLQTVSSAASAALSDKGWGAVTADIASGDVYGHASITAGSTDMDTVLLSLKTAGGEELVYVNGQLLTPSADYTLNLAGASPALSFTFGLKAEDVIMVVKV